MSDVDKFLARVVPWPSASLQGFVNIHWPGKQMPGRAFTDHQNAVSFTNGMLRNPLDLYVCMSLQSTAWPEKTKNGRNRRGAHRKQENAVALRSFYLDVDLKEFKTTQEAEAAFGQWRRKIGLPSPSLQVMTGSGGFHIHWVLDDPINLDAWQPIADALKEAHLREGFPADVKVTADAARILRIPGTFNHKHTPPHLATIAHEGPNYPLAAIAGPLAPYRVAYAPRVTVPALPQGLRGQRPSAVFAGVALPTSLDAGIEGYTPTLEDVINGGCGFLEATKLNHGAGYGEPLWFETLKIAYYLQQGEEVAHELSDGHATYSERGTDDKFDEVVRSHANQRIGWPQCRTIHDAGAQECRVCPHLPKGRSPLNFALPKVAVSIAAAAAIAVGLPTPSMARPPTKEWLPSPYQHDADKKVFVDAPHPQDENKTVRQYVLQYPIYRLSIYEPGSDGGNHLFGFDCEVRSDAVRKVAATFAQIMNNQKFYDLLGESGVLVRPMYLQRLKDFMSAFVEQLRDAKERITIYSNAPFGWFKAAGAVKGFVYNRNMYNGSAPVPVHPRAQRMDAEYYTPTGDLSKWKGIVKLITDQQRPELNVPICAGIGAPLVMITGMHGGVLHMWGESGSGKSYALKIAQSVWGSPGWIAQLQDTATSIDVMLGQLHHLPVVYDEMIKGNDRKLVDLFMRIGQGQSKKRATRTGQDIGETHNWHALMLSASNPNMHSYIIEHEPTNIAALNRMLQYQVLKNRFDAVGMLTTGSEAERAFGALSDNYGVAGLEVAKFFGANYGTVEKLVATLTDGIFNRGQCNADDRFYVAIIGVTLAGGLIGNKLGLIDVDMDQVEGFLMEQLQEQKLQRKSATSNLGEKDNIERLIAEFVADNRNRMLLTREVWTGSGRAPNGWSAGVVSISNHLRDEKVTVRGATQNKIIRLSIPAFNTWLRKERNMSFSDLRQSIKLMMPNARVSKWDLGHGVSGYTSSRILSLEITDPSFFDFN